MVIKRSAGQEIRALVEDLGAEDEVRREAAIGRLAVIGTRAVERVLAVLAQPARESTLVSALRALESIGDARAVGPALALLDTTADPDVAAAAGAVGRRFLHSKHGTEVFDRLVAIVLDRTRPEPARLAALDAIGEMESRALTPIWKQLQDDPSIAVRQRAARETGRADPAAELEAAAAGMVSPDPAAVSALVENAGAGVPLAVLHRLVEVVRSREAQARTAAGREGWLEARGVVHLALARRNSRVALYDLRETIERSTGPLPETFASALALIGDASTLDAIASAFHFRCGDAASGPPAGSVEDAWKQQLKAAFAAIAEREAVSGRHAVARRIESRWPDAAPELLSTLSRSRRASRRASRT